jgi:hypothetical protein
MFGDCGRVNTSSNEDTEQSQPIKWQGAEIPKTK